MTTMLQTSGLTEEGFVDIDGQAFYGIPNVDRLGPFLMSILSDSDHWMFVSSRGGLTAGRGDASSALFPYETDDRLHVAGGVTGPITVIRSEQTSDWSTWEPFTARVAPAVQRNLYKSIVGNQVIFEEVNRELDLIFRYRWANSDRFGFVRDAAIVNIGDAPIAVEIVDGLLNVLPDGLDPATYRAMGNLTNAYKRSEVIDAATRLSVFSLESRVVDRAEPAESLRASVIWSVGLDEARVGVDAGDLEAFRSGADPASASLVTGRPGAYLLTARRELAPGAAAGWSIVADVGRDQVQVVELLDYLRSVADPGADLAVSIDRGTESLVEILASADALQVTGDRMASAHHFANVAFNAMRGGVFVSGTRLDSGDFKAFVANRNQLVAARHESWLGALPATVDQADLMERARRAGDPHLIRLAHEYLPLMFSRRHGDPSRPWNIFSIRLRDSEGDPVIYYEGNWRDIFQNWEALCSSFPTYLPNVISVFLNASTPDGFNAYRITRNGIDWEVPEPDNPWSNIGYWGDHQIVYLLRLLDMARRFLPGVLEEMVGRKWFAYADVPYRIASYEDIVRDPRSTIEFDQAAADRSAGRVESRGQDGRLLFDRDGAIHLVTMAEKLLVPALSKLSNLVPGGGIWMNTQRPEWNDANNALVGNGLSMVTLCYLQRYLERLVSLLEGQPAATVEISSEVADWLQAITVILDETAGYLGGELSARQRQEVIDRLGTAFSDYRARVYAAGMGTPRTVPILAIVAMCERALDHLADTIRRNRRADGLYHSYNLARFAPDGSGVSVERLPEMLEGQVAVLSTGLLSPEERIGVLDALFASGLYRVDQHSFMLYPQAVLPSFLDKNVVPPAQLEANALLRALVSSGETSIVQLDGEGRCRFNAAFRNASDVVEALDRLGEEDGWRDLVARHRDEVVAIYEAVFNHHAYTGRSGSMYAYEGIGSIYWHMVAKLLVAVQESILEAADQGAADAAVARLVEHYRQVRAGLGFEKSAAEFGAFPMDPYSHTPAHAGAQQPGMTGQVKEEILTRLLELGIRVAGGEVRLDPILLQRASFLDAAETWEVRARGTRRILDIDPGSYGLTLCQVPVIVSRADGPAAIEVERSDGTRVRTKGPALDRETSAAIFGRSSEISAVHVYLPDSALR